MNSKITIIILYKTHLYQSQLNTSTNYLTNYVMILALYLYQYTVFSPNNFFIVSLSVWLSLFIILFHFYLSTKKPYSHSLTPFFSLSLTLSSFKTKEDHCRRRRGRGRRRERRRTIAQRWQRGLM